MAIRCKSILDMPALRKMKLVAGAKGLDRVVRWVHVTELPQAAQWVLGGELMFITGIGIKSDTQALMELVKSIDSRNLAGLVVNLGPYIGEIPRKVLELADNLNFPIFELPWEVKLVDVTQAICSAIITEAIEEKSMGHLLEDLLSGSFDSPESMRNRAAFHGCDLTKPCLVVIADIDMFSEYIRRKGIKDERKVLEIKNCVVQAVTRAFSDCGPKPLFTLRSDSVIVVAPAEDGKGRINMVSVAEKVKETVSAGIKGLTVSIGVGCAYSDLRDLKKSFGEAELALKVAKIRKERNKTLHYAELGVYRLLSRMGDRRDLEAYFNETLGGLAAFDRTGRHQFMDTLEAYLDEGGNAVKTAQRLHLHRNTLRYRLKRIEEITGHNLDDIRERLDLQMAFIVGRYIN